MTNYSPSQVWDSMSEEMKIEWMAKVMGWTMRVQQNKRNPEYIARTWHDSKGRWQMNVGPWDPLTDWNHWRQVEEKVMDTEHLREVFVAEVLIIIHGEEKILGAYKDYFTRIIEYARTNLRTRAKALFCAYHSLHE